MPLRLDELGAGALGDRRGVLRRRARRGGDEPARGPGRDRRGVRAIVRVATLLAAATRRPAGGAENAVLAGRARRRLLRRSRALCDAERQPRLASRGGARGRPGLGVRAEQPRLVGGVAIGAGAGGALGQAVGDWLPYALCAALLAATGGGRLRRRAPDARGIRAARYVHVVIVAELELDLEVFTGPFDLLLTLVLREEVDLLEVQLADVVVSYLDCLEARGELDLEVATEFLVLIAALLELKSRLMLPRRRRGAARGARRRRGGRGAARAHARGAPLPAGRRAPRGAAWSDERGHRFRSAPPPPFLRRVTYEASGPVYEPEQLGGAIGGMLRTPPPWTSRTSRSPRVSVAERLAHLRALLRRGVVDVRRARSRAPTG